MFPLGTVLLPSEFLPLNIFEPRYRALVTDCLAGEREFGVVLIERGSEVGGGDVRTSVGTIAHIVEVDELPDGRSHLLTIGTERFRVLAWLPDDPYPLADIEPWPDNDADDAGLDDRLMVVQGQLRRVLALASELGAMVPNLLPEFAAEAGLASFQACALAPVGPLDHFRLLCEPSARSRLDSLEKMLWETEQVLALQLGHGAGPGSDG